ncbi:MULTISPECIES: hypothetical protein [Enterobacterales]|uniref:hypothetical protein n=1 Tax=Enterobacterales TaxID=91347 RepID=UPI002ED965B9
MANTWLRLWHDMPNDPKWRTISRISGQPVSLVQATYIHILVSASQNVTRGHTDVTNEDLASALDVTEDDISSVIGAMQGRVLDGSYVSGWDKRQVKREESYSPENPAMTAAERKRKQRERERNRNGVTNGHDESRDVTPDKDKDKDKDKDLKTNMFESAWSAYPKRSGSNPKNRAQESWNARLKEGVLPETMIQGTERYRLFCDSEKTTGTKFVMQAQRFFGTSREFDNEWAVAFDPLLTISMPDDRIPPGFRGHVPEDQET